MVNRYWCGFCLMKKKFVNCENLLVLLARLTLWGGFHALKSRNNTELESGVAQCGVVPPPGPKPLDTSNLTPDMNFQKTKSTPMPVHHVKGQPDLFNYVKEIGGFTMPTNHETRCRLKYPHILTYKDIPLHASNNVSWQTTIIVPSLTGQLASLLSFSFWAH